MQNTRNSPGYLPRQLARDWARLSREFPVLLLTGPRQVGKTTLLEHVGKRRYVTLDDLAARELAKADPELFLQRFPPPVTIDEVQYAPELFPAIKRRVDSSRRAGADGRGARRGRAGRGGLFWLTGSQHFHAMKGVSETMAGRVGIVTLSGLSWRELREGDLSAPPFLPTARNIKARGVSAGQTDLRTVYRAIWTGGFPALAAGAVKDRDVFFRSYVRTYIQRDVMDLTQVGDQGAFLRFVRACAARTAQLLNMSDLARDADIAVNTAKHWLSILEGTGQVFLLPPLHSNLSKRLVKAPKLYFLDTGLCAYLTEWLSPASLEAGAMAGAMFETYAVGEVLKSWWNRGREPRAYFYRDHDGREVDLVLAQDRTFYPVEVKKSAAPAGAAVFDGLRVPGRVGEAAVICMAQDAIPLRRGVTAVPVGWV